MAQIELYSKGKLLGACTISEEQWAAIKYLDYFDLDQFSEFVETHGQLTTNLMLSYFEMVRIKFENPL